MFFVFLILVPLGFLLYYSWLTHTRDAPFVPMEADVAERVMRLAEVGPGEVFYDLGSGDGRLVIAAALHGARARGVEIDRLRVFYSRLWIWLLRLGDKAKIIYGDIFKTNISDATVVCTYLLPETHQKLKERLKGELAPGTKIVAVGFEYEDWKPVKADPRGTIYGPIMLYMI